MNRPLLLLISSHLVICFEFTFMRKNEESLDVKLSGKSFANMTMTGQYYEFTLSNLKFPMKPVIDLENGLSYVFGESCQGENNCRKGAEPVLFNLTESNSLVVSENFNHKISRSDSLSGKILMDIFNIGGLVLNTTFGYITSGTQNYKMENMTFGLGFGNDGMSDYKEPIKAIMDSVKDKGIVIMNGDKAGDGHIVFGMLNHSSCINMIMTKAQASGQGQQMWWIKFDSVTSGRGGDYDSFAAFDFTSDDLTLPKSLYESIGTDPVPSLDRLDNIAFKIDGYTIVLQPKDYTTLTSEGKFRPNIQQSDTNHPSIKLGASFYRNRCIFLNAENDNYQIGISQFDHESSGHMQKAPNVFLLVFILNFAIN